MPTRVTTYPYRLSPGRMTSAQRTFLIRIGAEYCESGHHLQNRHSLAVRCQADGFTGRITQAEPEQNPEKNAVVSRCEQSPGQSEDDPSAHCRAEPAQQIQRGSPRTAAAAARARSPGSARRRRSSPRTSGRSASRSGRTSGPSPPSGGGRMLASPLSVCSPDVGDQRALEGAAFPSERKESLHRLHRERYVAGFALLRSAQGVVVAAAEGDEAEPRGKSLETSRSLPGSSPCSRPPCR